MVKRNFKFQKNVKGEWYLILPEWKGDPADLQIVEGADKVLEKKIWVAVVFTI